MPPTLDEYYARMGKGRCLCEEDVDVPVPAPLLVQYCRWGAMVEVKQVHQELVGPLFGWRKKGGRRKKRGGPTHAVYSGPAAADEVAAGRLQRWPPSCHAGTCWRPCAIVSLLPRRMHWRDNVFVPRQCVWRGQTFYLVLIWATVNKIVFKFGTSCRGTSYWAPT